MSLLIGITGSIGSGKSAVGNILETLGIPVIDTDKIVHRLLSESAEVREKVFECFGKVILDDTTDNTIIDRAKLGKIVFQNEDRRKQLESIIHPAVLQECHKEILELSDSPIIAILVPLLFEADLADQYDEVWTVIADPRSIYERLQQRDYLSRQEIDQRLAAQIPQEQKAARSHRVIDNSGSLEETREVVASLLKQLRE